MLSLRELQMRFGAALLGREQATLADLVERGGPLHARGVAVYRNNVRESYTKTLATSYPVIARLVGENCFRNLARDYLREHPSESGDLNEFGGDFPRLLEARYGGSRHDYLADVAHLEWAYQRLLMAPEAPTLEPGVLASVEPRSYERLIFRRHPATGLVDSRYPVLEIWRSNREGSHGQHAIDLGAGPDRLLLRRTGEEIELRRMEAGEFTLAAHLAAGIRLGDALEIALSADPGLDLGVALARFLAWGLFTGFLIVD